LCFSCFETKKWKRLPVGSALATAVVCCISNHNCFESPLPRVTTAATAATPTTATPPTMMKISKLLDSSAAFPPAAATGGDGEPVQSCVMQGWLLAFPAAQALPPCASAVVIL